MRSYILLLLGLTTVLLLGLTPRPLFVPDWRIPYKKALAEEDCETIIRLRDILFHANDRNGLYEIYHTEQLTGLCDVEKNKTAGEEGLEFLPPQTNFIQRARYSSIFLSASQKTLADQIQSDHPFIKEAAKRVTQTERNCIGRLPPIGGGVDYELLRYALDNPSVDVDVIYRYAFERRSVCARTLLSDIKMIFLTAASEGDYETALNILYGYSRLGYMAPEILTEIRTIAKTIPEEALYDNPSIEDIIDTKRTEISTAYGCPWISYQTLEGAIDCAQKAFAASSSDPTGAAVAQYYIERAKRLGWRDIANIENQTSELLPQDCITAISQLEATDADSTINDPRAYDILNFSYRISEASGCENLTPLP